MKVNGLLAGRTWSIELPNDMKFLNISFCNSRKKCKKLKCPFYSTYQLQILTITKVIYHLYTVNYRRKTISMIPDLSY